MLNIGRLRKRITIQRQVFAQDEAGEQVEIWQVGQAMGRDHGAPGARAHGAQAVRPLDSHQVIMRYFPGLLAQDRISYTDDQSVVHIYNLTSVTDDNEAHDTMTCTAEEGLGVAAMSETVHVKGLDQLGKALRNLPLIVQRKVMNKATAKPAAIVRDVAKQIAPVYTGQLPSYDPQPGTLKKSIQIKRIAGLPPTRAIYIVWVRHGKSRQSVGKKRRNLDAYYWWWVEFGTAKMQARPFLRPAFQMSKEDCLRIQIDTLGSGIMMAAHEVAWGRPT